jgi:hypothetical protein
MPDASHPADSSAIVPAIKYERRMIGPSFRQSKSIGANNEQLLALG